MRPVHHDEAQSTADRYRAFAEVEAPGQSPLYEEWALGVADDSEVIALIDELDPPRRQTNLVFAAARAAGAPLVTYAKFRDWLTAHWPAVRGIAETRSTQTNEAARCAILLPLLARLPQPLALLEVGASAGLCLLPDRYSNRYGEVTIDPIDGRSQVLLEPRLSGPVPIPERMPDVVWRAGIDLNPLNVFDDSDTAWLETLVWPEHDARRERLKAAISVARREPPRIVRADVVSALAEVASGAPDDATLVVYHSAVMAYLTFEHRERFVAEVQALPGHWIATEGVHIVPGIAAPKGSDPSLLLVALDGQPVAHAGVHGQSLDWIA